MPLPAIPGTVDLRSSTFTPPPLDGSLTLPEMYDWHSEHTPEHPLFVYTEDDGTNRSLFYPAVAQAAKNAGRLVTSRLGQSLSLDDASTTPPVVAILAASDTIPYYITMLGIMRAGLTVFAISTRNSPSAVAHLLSKVDITHILVGLDRGSQELFAAMCKELRSDRVPPSSDMFIFEDLVFERDSSDISQDVILPSHPFPMERIAIILHSSGTTSHPKPIGFTHRRLLELVLVPWFGDQYLTGEVWAYHSPPMFHGLGLMALTWTASSGIILGVFKPSVPPIVSTPDNVFEGAVNAKSTYLMCVPLFVELWSREPERRPFLTSLKGLMFGGGPLNKEVGDSLVKDGTKLFSLYGQTECGLMNVTLPEDPGKDWEYFRMSAHCQYRFVPESENAYELVMLVNEYQSLGSVNTKLDGFDAFATNDLFIPHPSKPGYWKLYGRKDDQLMLSSGEKTNPGPLESIFKQDPHIAGAVMFGRARPQNGVILEPRPAFAFDPSDRKAIARFLDLIWQTVEKVNQFAPTHSRIFREMILVASPSKPFTYTTKSEARRGAIIAQYQDEINALYDDAAITASVSVETPQIWSLENSIEFVRAAVKEICKRTIADEDSLFENGFDSLQAIWLRNVLLHTLRASLQRHNLSSAVSVPMNIVYQHPSIRSLATFVSNECLTPGVQAANTVEDKLLVMDTLIKRHTSDFPLHVPSIPVPSSDVVLLTGSTGGLGSNLLAQLADSPYISRIYAVNRRGKDRTTLLERQTAALTRAGLSSNILSSEKIVLVEADLDNPGLGILDALREEMRTSVTHIIHNAWPVDFNLALVSFESAIRGTRALIDFALSSSHATPPRLLFTSSIGVFRQLETPGPAMEAPITDARTVIGMGYGESKWITERILQAAAERTPVRTVIVRIGQMSGGVNGFWNTSEWLPLLVRSGINYQRLPIATGMVSWIPLHTAATVIMEMRNSPEPVLHLRHPNAVPWCTIFDLISRELNIPLVPYREWLSWLEMAADAMSEGTKPSVMSPSLRLLDFYKGAEAQAQVSKAVEDMEAMGLPTLSVSRALQVSETLRRAGSHQLGAADVKLWVKYWRRVEFLPWPIIGHGVL